MSKIQYGDELYDIFIEVTFKAVRVPDGTGPNDILIMIPKSQYILSSEDNSCYYVKPVESLSEHAELPS